MQLLLIFGIAFAIAAVMFALQNNVPVTVTFVFWRFDSSLALVLLLPLGLGAFIAGLVSSPSAIKGKWTSSRMRRQIAELENDKASNLDRIRVLEAELARVGGPIPPSKAEEPKSYVGLKALVAGRDPR